MGEYTAFPHPKLSSACDVYLASKNLVPGEKSRSLPACANDAQYQDNNRQVTNIKGVVLHNVVVVHSFPLCNVV